MKRLSGWLKSKLSQPKATVQSSEPVSVESDNIVDDDYSVEVTFDSGVPGRLDTHDSRKNVLMPDIYVDGHDVTEPDLKILDQSSTPEDKSEGFNPYDTGVLQKK